MSDWEGRPPRPPGPSQPAPPGGGQREGGGGRPAPPPAGRPSGSPPPGIAAAITEVSERASVLVREEIELAKAEIAEKATRMAKGAIVGIVAGVFFLTALFFVLVGCAWLLYFELPIGNEFTYFWGFFAMAVILVVLGALAGFAAARALRSGAPPTPDMAIAEARKIRETVSASGASESSAAQSAAGRSEPFAGERYATEAVPPLPAPGAKATGGEAASGPDTGKGGGYGTAISG